MAVAVEERARMFGWQLSSPSDLYSQSVWKVCQLAQVRNICYLNFLFLQRLIFKGIIGKIFRSKWLSEHRLDMLAFLCSKRYNYVQEFIKPGRVWATRGRKEASTLLCPARKKKCMHSTQGSWVKYFNTFNNIWTNYLLRINWEDNSKFIISGMYILG